MLAHEPAEAIAIGRAADAAGVDIVGVADSPARFAGTYAITALLLGETARVRIGPMVTNPVTCHPAVHGANLATLSAAYPGRLLAVLGTGDSGTAALGLPSAPAAVLGTAIRAVAERAGPGVPVWAAASGPRAASAVPREATAVLLGGGLEPGWLNALAARAESAAGHRLERWAFAVGNLVERPDQLAGARSAASAAVLAVSRHSLGRDPGRGRRAQADLIPGLAALYARYDVRAHGEHAGANADVLAGWPAEAEYLFQRFGAIGTAASLSSRLAQVAAAARLDGFIFTTSIPDPADHVRRIGRDLRPLLAGG